MKNILFIALLLTMVQCKSLFYDEVDAVNVNGSTYNIIRKKVGSSSEYWNSIFTFSNDFIYGADNEIFVFEKKYGDYFVAYNPFGVNVSNRRVIVTSEGTLKTENSNNGEDENFVIGRMRDNPRGFLWSNLQRPGFTVKKIRPILTPSWSNIAIAGGNRLDKIRFTFYEEKSGSPLYEFSYSSSIYQNVQINDFWYESNIKNYSVVNETGAYYIRQDYVNYLYAVGYATKNGVKRPYILTLNLIDNRGKYSLEVINEEIIESVIGEFDEVHEPLDEFYGYILGHTEDKLIMLTSKIYNSNSSNNVLINSSIKENKSFIFPYVSFDNRAGAESKLTNQKISFKFLISPPLNGIILKSTNVIRYSGNLFLSINFQDKSGSTKVGYFANHNDLSTYKVFSRGTIEDISPLIFSGGFPEIESVDDKAKEIVIRGGYRELIELYYSGEVGNRTFSGNEKEMSFMNSYKCGATNVKLDYDPTRKVLIVKSCKGLYIY